MIIPNKMLDIIRMPITFEKGYQALAWATYRKSMTGNLAHL
jgi:hypothetical protein